MLLSFGKKMNKIGFNEVPSSPFTVALISADEFKNHYSLLGISMREYVCFDLSDSGFRSSVTVNSESFIFSVRVVDPSLVCAAESSACIYLRKNLVLIVTVRDDAKLIYNAVYAALDDTEPNGISVEKFTGRFLHRLIENDGRKNEETEIAINELEETVIEKGRYKNVNEQILAYNKKLVSLRNYYEQLVGIAERLYENGNGIFDGEKAYYFKAVADRSNRLCSEINLFRENLVRLREAYQARLDLKMNSTMKLLTVITVIFLPLTLITGWYGMNFVNMPELSSPYGYPAVIAVSVAIVISCIIIFRKKKLL